MIYIIIPVFNRWHLTEQCLLSLLKQNNCNYKIVVVDHGSSDNTSEKLKLEFPEVIILAGNDSMWWTAATNLGVQYALSRNANFVLTLNNDLEVQEDYLDSLLKIYQENKPCLVGSITVDFKNQDDILFIGGTWNKYFAKYKAYNKIYKSLKKLESDFESIESDMLPGRGVLIPIDAFHKVGVYDEIKFPHYCADDDFSLRCKSAGFKLVVSVKSIVKSYTEETNRLFKFKNFTSIRSPFNLNTRFNWAKKHTPIPIMYFVIDIARIITSQLVKNKK
jgi:GT2 family glycosyltransferase